MASDAVTVIMNDHRVLEKLFDQLLSGQGDRLALLDEVGARLEAHSRAEEDHVYPEILVEEPEESTTVYHGYEEHHEAAAMLYAIKQMEPDDPMLMTKLTEFVNAVRHHVEEEETEILPALAESAGQQRLAELGAEFEYRRVAELAKHGIEESPAAGPTSGGGRSSRGGGSRGSGGQADMTRDELYERAKAADIPGRSSMSKDELARAVRKAER